MADPRFCKWCKWRDIISKRARHSKVALCRKKCPSPILCEDRNEIYFSVWPAVEDFDTYGEFEAGNFEKYILKMSNEDNKHRVTNAY